MDRPADAYHSRVNDRSSGSTTSGLVGFLLALAFVAVLGALAFAAGFVTLPTNGPAVGAASSSPGASRLPLASPTAVNSPAPAATAAASPLGSAPATAGPTPGGTYIVQAGDALFLIGEKFGIPWQLIAEVNGIEGPDYVIQLGQELIIPIPGAPSAGADSYIIQAGDTVTSIALEFGVSPTDLADFNNLVDWDSIRVGDILYIPGPGWTPLPKDN